MKIKKIIGKVLFKLPPWNIFDRAIALAYFWVAHHRLPSRKSGLFNDYLYFLKTSIEIEYPLRQFVSDKDLVKIFYRGIFQEDVAPRTLMKFTDFDSFMKADLPDICILKPTHLSGGIFINSGKSSLSQDQLELVRVWFSTNSYDDIGRERNYRLLKPSVICEEVIASQADVRDYKIFCFHGEPNLIQVDIDRHSNHKRRLYTQDWYPLPFCYNKPLAEIEPRPEGLDHALELAKCVASYFDFIRVDTYLIDGRVYLGELTNIPENAHGRFDNNESECMFMDILKSGAFSNNYNR
ncbi:ATP-grasp fold amidoligase family protein [Nitrosomonas sp. wSCUT-2]